MIEVLKNHQQNIITHDTHSIFRDIEVLYANVCYLAEKYLISFIQTNLHLMHEVYFIKGIKKKLKKPKYINVGP